MDDAFSSLSWSAVPAGWPTLFLSVAEVRKLAEARLLTASDAALVPMSDLACLNDDDARQEAQDALTRLAILEDLPGFFVQREWQVYMLQQELDRLPSIHDKEEPELTSYWQMQVLERFWEMNGQPLDLPGFNPLIRSYVGWTKIRVGFNLRWTTCVGGLGSNARCCRLCPDLFNPVGRKMSECLCGRSKPRS